MGKEGGVKVTRDDARERAAAAAEARANQAGTRGQQGTQSKMKQSSAAAPLGGRTGKPDLADARTWD